MTKDVNVNFKSTRKERDEFMKFAKKIDIPFSQIAREAIREKIAELKRTHPRFQKQANQVQTA